VGSRWGSYKNRIEKGQVRMRTLEDVKERITMCEVKRPDLDILNVKSQCLMNFEDYSNH
jgi:hypothetical protein